MLVIFLNSFFSSVSTSVSKLLLQVPLAAKKPDFVSVSPRFNNPRPSCPTNPWPIWGSPLSSSVPSSFLLRSGEFKWRAVEFPRVKLLSQPTLRIVKPFQWEPCTATHFFRLLLAAGSRVALPACCLCRDFWLKPRVGFLVNTPWDVAKSREPPARPQITQQPEGIWALEDLPWVKWK